MSREGKSRPVVAPSLGSYATNGQAIEIARRVARLELLELERRVAERSWWGRLRLRRPRQEIAQAMLDEALAVPASDAPPTHAHLRLFATRNAECEQYIADGGVALVPPVIASAGTVEMCLVVAHASGAGPKMLRQIAGSLHLDVTKIGDQTVELRLSGAPLQALQQRMRKVVSQ
jgi:hypothetical protein